MSGGPEILLHIDRSHPETLAGQLRAGIRDSIRARRLAAGTRLPASRVLAEDLGVSRGVVIDAYAQLVAEGFLVTRPGSGTMVSDAAGITRRTRHGGIGAGSGLTGCGGPSLTCGRPARTLPCSPARRRPGP
jgi:GntR family transcriptional regulator / MocR family aminotransferase